MVALTILAIALAFIALFVLPFFFVSSKVFKDKDLIFRTYTSMAIGLFTSIAIVYLLVALGAFTKISFLVIYIPIIALVNLYFLRGSKWSGLNFNIKPRWTIPTILLIIAFCLGFYMRFYPPITHVSLPALDPWSHLFWAKKLEMGEFFVRSFAFTDYPKGLHAILVLMHFYSGSSIYSLLRFAGALFGVISIGAVYCLVSYIGGRYAGAIASISYSCFQWLGVSMLARQTFTMPEPLVFILMLLALLFALNIIKDLKSREMRKKNIALFTITVLSLALIHPVTMLFTSYLLFLLLFLSLIFYKNIRHAKPVLALILLFSLGMLVVRIYYYTTNAVFNIPFSEAEAPPASSSSFIYNLLGPEYFHISFDYILVLLLSIGITAYGAFKRKLPYAFVGTSCILFNFMAMTNCLVIYLNPGRAVIYYSFILSWIIGISIIGFANRVAIGEILKKIGNSRYTRWLGEISQSTLYSLYYILLGIGVSGFVCRGIFQWMNYAHPVRMAAPIALIVGITIFIIVKIKLMRKNKMIGKELRRSKKFVGTTNGRFFKVVVAVAFALVLFTPSNNPYTNLIGYEGGYDDFADTALRICDEFPLENVTTYSLNFMIYYIIYPQGSSLSLKTLITSSPDGYIPKDRYTFIFIEKIMHPKTLERYGNESIETMENAKEWINDYKENHNDINVYYESKEIIVYLIERK